jgi:hypothetical protein
MALAGHIWLVIAILFLLYIVASIARDIYWDIKTRPLKNSNQPQRTVEAIEKKKVLLRKVNKTRARVE